ncbi:MAG: ABC transporter ATP-binding protein [Ruminococcus sp.]|nr:ABC transporter ATP-binding protein [Ruminococcus sp.]
MSNNVLFKVDHINKTIGSRQILHDVSFEAYAGEVFGFLGPNGAGKTTTIKIAVGLISSDSGSVEIDGVNVKKDFEKAMSSVGAIVENPEMYKYLTGRKNLEQYARIREGVTKERIDEVVRLVKLENRINDKISKYSLGMRQRLGVAQAILHHPKVLILDEPTNGLDPAGIKELRDILKGLAHNEGICVIISSHLMSEMELMCDRVGIIANGKMIGVHTLEEFTNASKDNSVTIRLRVDNPALAAKIVSVSKIDGSSIEVKLSRENSDKATAQIVKQLVDGMVEVYSITEPEHKSLEDAFIQLTAAQQGGGQIG